MADATSIAALRRAVDDTEAPFMYDDGELSDRLDAAVTPSALATQIWGEKAASYSDMVNMSEAGSSRNLSDLHKNALAMAQHYKAIADGEATTSGTGDVTTTRPIVRA